MQEYYTKQHIYCQNNTTYHGHKSNRKKLNILGGVTDVAKQSLMAAGSGLLKAKGPGKRRSQLSHVSFCLRCGYVLHSV